VATHKAPLDSIAKASSAPMERQDEFGCRTLTLFKGAGFVVLFAASKNARGVPELSPARLP
jgi:hypothetical protein